MGVNHRSPKDGGVSGPSEAGVFSIPINSSRIRSNSQASSEQTSVQPAAPPAPKDAYATAVAAVTAAVSTLYREVGKETGVRLLLDSMVSYQRFLREQQRYETKLVRTDSERELYRQQVIGAAQAVTGELQALQADTGRRERLVADLLATTSVNKTHTDAMVWWRQLAERRAHIRAYVQKCLLHLSKLTDHTTKQRALRSQLQEFTVLDTFSHLPADGEEAARLSEVLDRLEPRYKQLQHEIQAVLDTPIVPPAPASTTDRVTDTVDAAVPPRIPQAPPEPRAPVVDLSARPHQSPPPRATTSTPTRPKIEVSSPEVSIVGGSQVVDNALGVYRLQRGDTLSDILSGESSAGTLPCAMELDQGRMRAVIGSVQAYMQLHKRVRQLVGFLDHEYWWIDRQGEVEISLDRLNDVVMYVAIQYRLVEIPPENNRALRRYFSQYEDGEAGNDSVTQSTHQRRFSPSNINNASTSKTAHATLKQLEENAIEGVYYGNAIAYRASLRKWIERQLIPCVQTKQKHNSLNDSIQAVLELSPEQWDYISRQPTQRYEWLIAQGIRPSGWRDLAKVIQHWMVVAASINSTEPVPSLYTLARLTFAVQSVRSQSK